MKALYFESISETKEYVEANKDLGVVLFASHNDISVLSRFIHNNVVLCSTTGEFTKYGYKENVVTGFSYKKDRVEIVEIEFPPLKSLSNLQNAYDRVKDNSNAFMLLLCDGLSGIEESIMTTLYFVDDNFKIVGGSAGDDLKFEETLIYIGNKRVNSVGIFFNSERSTQVIKENIFFPMDSKMLVTEIDSIGRTVKSFNNKPASQEYARVIGVDEDKLANYFISNPLGKYIDDSVYIVSPMKINKDKSITFYSQLKTNTILSILTVSELETCFKETKASMKFIPSFALSINCVLRSLKFLNEHLWGYVESELLDICKNHTGFISYGEQYYKHHLNQTMVLLLVE